MPCNYKLYPKNWLSEIRPRILQRANYTCEMPGCNFQHLETIWAVRHKGKSTWFRSHDEALKQPRTISGSTKRQIQNPKPVRVILTIAHLDHDECNPDVTDERLMAMCQLCHLRYDAPEKYKRSLINT